MNTIVKSLMKITLIDALLFIVKCVNCEMFILKKIISSKRE